MRGFVFTGFLFLFTLSIFSISVQAQEEVKPSPEAQQHAKELKVTVDKLAAGLSDENKAHFMTIYSNYNLIKTVEVVRGDIAKAVQACGEKNPDLKVGIEAKFEEWKKAVNPIIEEATSHLDNMVIAQDYLEGQQIRDLFKDVDETREAVQGQIEKTPVTSAKACETMSDKMSGTQANMAQLLRSTLISLPQMRFSSPDATPEAAEEQDSPVNNEEADDPIAAEEDSPEEVQEEDEAPAEDQ